MVGLPTCLVSLLAGVHWVTVGVCCCSTVTDSRVHDCVDVQRFACAVSAGGHRWWGVAVPLPTLDGVPLVECPGSLNPSGIPSWCVSPYGCCTVGTVSRVGRLRLRLH
jgi:hypothetical protein